MANTFKVVSHDVMPASAGTPEDLYTTPGSTTTVVIGLLIANIHTAQITASVKLVSNTAIYLDFVRGFQNQLAAERHLH